MNRKWMLSAAVVLVCFGIVGCAYHKTPTMVQPWGGEGARFMDKLRFERGTGTFEGVDVAVVGRDERSGAVAAYVRVPAGAKADANSMHVHTGSAHSIILKGTVTSIIDGREVAAGPGDYFYEVPNDVHASSGSPDGAVVFMLTEGPFETRGVQANEAASTSRATGWVKYGRQTADSMQFTRGTGTFEGLDVAVLGRNPATGGTAVFLKLPANPPKAMQAFEKQLHYHTSSSHALVVRGSVSSIVDGKRVTLKAGDYYRGAANHVHAESGSTDGALIFMVTDGQFETVASRQ